MKKIYCSLVALFALTNIFALPGFTEFLPTENAQYVYYKDFTQDDETYIGFLYYSDSAISVRTFSLTDEGEVENATEILFSLDPNANHIELTGEKLPENTTNENVSSINYIHNMLYELSALRMHATNAATEKSVCETQDFPLFGGQVQVTYDFRVPFFNIESICKISGEKLFQAVTFGTLSNSSDLSFSNFSGFDEKLFQTKAKKSKAKKNATYEWQTSSESPVLSTLGNDAVMWKFPLNYPQELLDQKNTTLFDHFSRVNLLSSSNSYVYFPNAKLIQKDNKLIANYQLFSPQEENKLTHVIKIVEKSEKGSTLTIISCYEKFYQENKTYFDSL